MKTTTLTPYWRNTNLASSLWSEMDRFFEDFGLMSPLPTVYDERAFSPQCDVSETDNHLLVSVDLPGMKKDDIKIEVVNNMLTLSGERKNERVSDKAERMQHFERSYGFFKRSFTLPVSIEADKVEARYENGVLELYMPKAESAKPRQIEIQSGKGGVFERLLSSKKNNQEVKDVKVS